MTAKNKSAKQKEETRRADNDSPWKEILEAYFPQAMQFFFPRTAALIDWQRPHEFLDKEFQKIDPDASVGRRYVDKLVKVWLLEGNEAWLLIHIEIQAEKEDDFSERMFMYNINIYKYYRQGAISVAILCDTDSNWRPSGFGFDYPDTQLGFNFSAVKLLDYQNRFDELEKSDNPFATVIMAHLRTQQTASKPQERKTWKFSLIRRLYQQGLEAKDIYNLYKFIDWVMILPKALEAEVWQEVKEFEQERKMTYITTGERIGYERGVEEGRQQGQQEGRQEGRQEQAQAIVIRLLQRRLGELPQSLQTSIENLPVEKLENLGDALLDFTSLEDLQNWLQNN